MSFARKIIAFLLPAKAAYVLTEAVAAQRIRYQKQLLKSYGSGFYLARDVIVHAPGSISVGDRCVINEFVHLLGRGGITIGHGVAIANHASLITESHPADVEYIGDEPFVTAPIVVCDNVWIGSHAVILPGVTLGRSCIVGASSVVTKDVPPYAVVAGIPAKILRYKSICPE